MDVRVLLLVLAGLGVGQLAYGRFRLLSDAVARDPIDPVATGPENVTADLAIVIPARNESLSLPLLLDDLAVNRPENSCVIVVDDDSEDDTAALAAAHPFVEVLSAPTLPPGWTGKNSACHTGATQLDDRSVVVFLDADVRVAPGALDTVVEAVQRSGGLVSVQPFHVVRRLDERFSALFGVVAVIGSRAGHRRPTGAYGPVLATSVADYRLVGGHASVADAVVEDLALARRYRDAELPVTVRAGGDLIRYRMYPDGFASLIEGWSKNLASGARSTSFSSLVGVAAWVTALCSVTLSLIGIGPLGSADAPVLAAVYATVVTQLVVMFRRVGAFSWGTALAFPVLVACFVAVFARSVYLGSIRGSVRWRGRDIPVSRSLHPFTR